MKRTSLAAALAAIALLAGACGDDGSSSSNGDGGDGSATSACPVDAFKKASGKTKVVVWSSYVGRTQQALEKIADAYNQSQDKVEVEVEEQRD